MEKVESRGGIALAAVVATLLLLPPSYGAAVLAAAAAPVQENNCTRSCGGISIPYPFGVEPGCYHASGFNLTCDHPYRPPRLFLGDGTVEVLEISASSSTVSINSSFVKFTDNHDGRTANGTWGGGLPKGGPFFLSADLANSVVVVGCEVQVDVRGGDNNDLLASCLAMCPASGPPYYDSGCPGAGCCPVNGAGCCQANVMMDYSFYNIQIHMLDRSFDPYGYSVYIADDAFNSTVEDFSGYHHLAWPVATLDWVVSNSTCPTDGRAPECLSANSACSVGHSGYSCNCSGGYQGNPYVVDGCQGGDMCLHQGGFKCHGTCLDIDGNYYCRCPKGTDGDPYAKEGCSKIKKSFAELSGGLGGSGVICFMILVLAGPFVTRKFKLRKVKKMKEKFFKQNHGLLLQQLVSQKADIGERMIITLSELEKATNNFDRARVVGGGGHGVVFKGILDLHVVAIKKSKIVVQREINEFINEVVVLSQVNHRNVVKLLGCCLEAEVPLLVYEVISNGTLYHHLHVERPISLPWDDRVRIALEVARALSYLHSAASMPIFHRDIKSSNILLDETLTTKVSDFGASRYIPIDKTGITTAVQGTIGYLDPMYYYTGRLTDKSDVFSFGVLIIELPTRKKPFFYRSNDGDGLVSHFVSLLGEGKLIDMIDPQVIEEEEGQVLQEVGELAAMCAKLKGEDRPTMREVEMELEKLLVKKKQVPYDTTRRYENENVAYKPIERVTKESSRQYTMEEEILLSASYPR